MGYEILNPSAEEMQAFTESLHTPHIKFTNPDSAWNDGIDVAELDDSLAEERVVEASIARYDLGSDQTFDALTWKCNSWERSILYAGGKEFLAKNMTWTYGRIAWVAGGGWPLYETPCVGRSGRISHSIMVQFGNRSFSPCTVPFSGSGSHMTSVSALVSDDKYNDNTGFFILIVTSYSTT